MTSPVATLFVHHGIYPRQAHEQRQRSSASKAQDM